MSMVTTRCQTPSASGDPNPVPNPASDPNLSPATEPNPDAFDHPTGTSGRPVRSRRLPARFRDVLPEPSLPSTTNLDAQSSECGTSNAAVSWLPRVILHVFDSFRTSFNKFGVARYYRHRPSHDPDAFLTIDQLSNAMPRNPPNSITPFPSLPLAPPWPWKNMGIWQLMTWMITGSRQKSEAELSRLVHEVILSNDFDRSHFTDFNAHTQMRHFDKSENVPDGHNTGVQQDGWQEGSVNISVPTRERNPDGNEQTFIISGPFHRPLFNVIRAVFSEAAAKSFHFTPFRRIWRSPITGQEQRLYDELYTSDAWIQAHDELQKQRRDDGCDLERVIAALMFWSDATHLAQFGNASAWPVYLFFGNQSKYARASADAGACHPVAFIPSVSLACVLQPAFVNS